MRNTVNGFWIYYLNIESDLNNTLRYVELDESNYNTYSIEYVKCLLTICSEVDVLCKELCKVATPNAKAENIKDYIDNLKEVYPKLCEYSVIVTPKINLTPWYRISEQYAPEWWIMHNKVKHERSENFTNANLKNCINALAGLYILNIYYCCAVYGSCPNTYSILFDKQVQPQTLINENSDPRLPADFKIQMTNL